MDSASHITVAVKPELIKSKLKMGALEPGSILKLKIIELQGDRAVVDFGKFRTSADIKMPVTLGEELMVRVIETGDQLKLGVINRVQENPVSAELSGQRLTPPSAENLNQVQNDLSRILNQAADSAGGKNTPSSIFNIFEKLNAYFEPFELKDLITDLLPRLKSHLENSGIFFEKSLERIIYQVLEEKDLGSTRSLADLAEIRGVFTRDLKPNLLLLRHFIEEKGTLQKIFDPKTLAVLKGAIDTLLADMTRQQGRAVSQLLSAAPFQVYTFTLPLTEGDRTAKLKVFYEKKQKSGSRKGFRISLLLSMDQLGDIRTDFFQTGNDLSITFYVKAPSALVAIQENYRQLDELLHDLYDHIQFKVKVSGKKVRDFDRPDVHLAGNRRVDVRI